MTNDETITQAERDTLIGRHKGGSQAASDIRWLLDALAAAEKRAEEAKRSLVLCREAMQIGEASLLRTIERAQANLARLQPHVDAARAVREAYAAVGGDEGLIRAAPELADACALVLSIASTHDNPWVREIWTTTRALMAVALAEEARHE